MSLSIVQHLFIDYAMSLLVFFKLHRSVLFKVLIKTVRELRIKQPLSVMNNLQKKRKEKKDM